ncbi:MAG TPA: VWA domain-containing protein [Pyrinomonadaceae bacterium]|nr:VWA domain-containing protein [Pyrinomonadaceae bacterium]
MLKILQSMVVVAVLGVVLGHAQEVDSDDVIRVKTTLVNSPVLVLGRDGKFVPNLRREDFQIFENGVKQEISYFAPVENPFTVALLIDTSRSTVFNLQDIQQSAIAFVEKLRPDDRVAVVSFSDEINVVAEATSDRETLTRAIRSIRPGGGSRVYDALDVVFGELQQIKGRTALVLFSDGVDNDSRKASFESTLRTVERTDTLIYPVRFDTFKRRPAPSGISLEGTGFSEQDYRRAGAFLSRLAEISNTGVYPASELSDVERAIASIVDELHNEYSVGYYPRTPGKAGETRDVEVRINRPQLTVRALTRYVVDRSGRIVRAANPQRPALATAVESDSSLPISRNDPSKPVEGHWICKSPDVPSNMAIVREGFVAHCPKGPRANGDTNAWLIKKPAREEKICKAFLMWQGREVAAAPVPEGYVVVGEIKSPSCANSSNPEIKANAWEIRVPGPSETVCKGFPLPHGYVMIGERIVSNCPTRATDQNAWLIRKQ